MNRPKSGAVKRFLVANIVPILFSAICLLGVLFSGSNPAVILMDEATHALDSAAEEQIRRNMERLPVTRIIIAQRLSTVVNADRIYVLNKGRVEQCGTCRELLAQEGLFRELAERQMLYRESETR